MPPLVKSGRRTQNKHRCTYTYAERAYYLNKFHTKYEDIHQRGNPTQFARDEGLNPRTFLRWIQNETTILKIAETSSGRKNLYISLFPKLDEALLVWYREVRANNPSLTISYWILWYKANKLAKALGFPKEKLPKDEEAQQSDEDVAKQSDENVAKQSDEDVAKQSDEDNSSSSDFFPSSDETDPNERSGTTTTLQQPDMQQTISPRTTPLAPQSPPKPGSQTSSTDSEEVSDNDTDYEKSFKQEIEDLVAGKLRGYVSLSWVKRWRIRVGLRYKKRVGQAGDSHVEEGDNWVATKFLEFLDEYGPTRIYNADECGIFWKQEQAYSLLPEDEPPVGFKQSKERITVMSGYNLLGARLPILVIGKPKPPPSIPDVDPQKMHYRQQAKAWMTTPLFNEWLSLLEDYFKNKQPEETILLVVDNCASHKVTQEYAHVHVVMLPPVVTATHQPMDAGIIAALKLAYKRIHLSTLYQQYLSAGKPNTHATPRPVAFVEALTNVYLAFEAVKEETVRHCFYKAWASHLKKPRTDLTATPNPNPTVSLEETAEEKDYIDHYMEKLKDAPDEDCHVSERLSLEQLVKTQTDTSPSPSPSKPPKPFTSPQLFTSINTVQKALDYYQGPELLKLRFKETRIFLMKKETDSQTQTSITSFFMQNSSATNPPTSSYHTHHSASHHSSGRRSRLPHDPSVARHNHNRSRHHHPHHHHPHHHHPHHHHRRSLSTASTSSSSSSFSRSPSHTDGLPRHRSSVSRGRRGRRSSSSDDS